MIHVFFGKDTAQVRQKAHAFAQGYVQKGVRIEHIDNTNYQKGMIADAVGAVSLFGEQTLFIIDTPSSDPIFQEEVMDMLPQLSSHESIFVIIEGVLLAPEKKKFARLTEHLDETKGETAQRFNTFALSDALLARNKKQLWMGLCEATESGVSAEEIIGILWWQLKTLRLVARSKTAEEAGMKDFTFNKAKRALMSFKQGEIERLSQSLLEVYHQGHAGEHDIDLALEKWTLSL